MFLARQDQAVSATTHVAPRVVHGAEAAKDPEGKASAAPASREGNVQHACEKPEWLSMVVTLEPTHDGEEPGPEGAH